MSNHECLGPDHRSAPPGVAHERGFWEVGLPLVAGVDEVGRGALAGPLVAAAVVLPCCTGRALARLRAALGAVRDSKLLRPEQRAALVAPVTAAAVSVAVGLVEAAELDLIGLAAANRLAMERAVLGLAVAPDVLLLDACVVDLGLPQVGLIDGDAHCLSIAAASIIAKVHRDRLMVEHDRADARFAFAAHKGYGSALHLRRLREHGPGPEHRRCFAPVAAFTRPALGPTPDPARGPAALTLPAGASAGSPAPRISSRPSRRRESRPRGMPPPVAPADQATAAIADQRRPSRGRARSTRDTGGSRPRSGGGS